MVFISINNTDHATSDVKCVVQQDLICFVIELDMLLDLVVCQWEDVIWVLCGEEDEIGFSIDGVLGILWLF